MQSFVRKTQANVKSYSLLQLCTATLIFKMFWQEFTWKNPHCICWSSMFIIILSKEIFVWKNHSNNENNPRIWKNLLHSSPYGKVCGSSFILYKSLSWLLISKYQWDWSTLVQRSSRIGFIYLWTSWDLFSSMSWSWQWANEVLIHTDNITVVVIELELPHYYF